MPHPTSPVPGAGQAVSSALAESIGTLSGLDSTGLSNALRSLIEGQGLTQEARLFQLELGAEPSPLDEVLLIHQAEITEQVCEDESLRMRLLCFSTRAGLSEQAFLGQPARVRVVTDRGSLRDFCGIVRRAVPGPSTGGEQAWLIEAVDALTLLDRGSDERIFLHGSVLDIVQAVFAQWQQRSSAIAQCVDLDLGDLRPEAYPVREFCMQAGETDVRYALRLLRKSSLGWTIVPGTRNDPAARAHTIRLFDADSAVPANAAGTVRYHLDGATQQRDAVTDWMREHQLMPSAAWGQAWDYKTFAMHSAQATSGADPGEQGMRATAGWVDHQIHPPHWGDSAEDLARLTERRMMRHEMTAHTVHGGSGLRDAACRTAITVTGLPDDPLGSVGQEIVFTQVRHFGRNNFGPEADARLQSLFARAGWHIEQPLIGTDPGSRRYGNTFKAVRRDVPIVPDFEPRIHWPQLPPRTVIVAGPPGQEVHCDELGRYPVVFPGVAVYDLRTGDQAEGFLPSGATPLAARTQATSAYLRKMEDQASAGFGTHTPPRVGDEMVVAFLGGSPDKPLMLGGVPSPHNPHPRLGGRTAMPGNRHLSGLREQEVSSQRASELLIDSTPGQTRVQAASDHAHSHIGAGYLVHPREDGQAEPLGEGLYQCTDAAAATRAARGILQSAWARLNASGKQMDYQEALALMETGLALFKSMGEYAAAHQGVAPDAASQQELKDKAANWQAGTNTDPKGEPQDTAIIALTSPEGIAANTAKSIVQFAGENVDTVAQQHLQWVAGQRCTLNAGQGISQFAHAGGIRHIAHQGPFVMQSQREGLQAVAQGNIDLTSVAGEINLVADAINLISPKTGSHIRIDADILLGTGGSIQSKAARFPHSGPATMQAERPEFSSGQPDQRFQLRMGGGDGPIAADCAYEIHLSDGSVVSGTSDAQGLTSVLLRDAMHIARVNLLSRS